MLSLLLLLLGQGPGPAVTPETIRLQFAAWVESNPKAGPWGGIRTFGDPPGSPLMTIGADKKIKPNPYSLTKDGFIKRRDAYDQADDAGKKKTLDELELWVSTLKQIHKEADAKFSEIEKLISKDKALLAKLAPNSQARKMVMARLDKNEKARLVQEGTFFYLKIAQSDTESLIKYLEGKL